MPEWKEKYTKDELFIMFGDMVPECFEEDEDAGE